MYNFLFDEPMFKQHTTDVLIIFSVDFVIGVGPFLNTVYAVYA